MNAACRKEEKVSMQGEKPEIQQTASGFTHTTARSVLNLVSCAKTWGSELNVSPQQVNRWKNGETIPSQRQFQIVQKAPFYLRDYRELEGAILELLAGQYGKSDPGRF